MNNIMKRNLAAAIVAVSLGLTGGVSAQSLSRMIAETGLTPQDFDILSDTARGLYETSTPVAGRTASWSNPESGSKGQVRLTAVEGNCVDIQHLVRAKAATKDREIRSRRCKDASGKWLMSAG